MKILLAYGTLSGSTMTAADIITTALIAAGAEVTEVTADSATREMVTSVDTVVLGSPSWEDEGKDGQPLPEVRKFVESLSKEDLLGKRVAIFGLGDTSYPHFCGAVDVLEEKLKAIGVTPVIPSLRIDRYYSSPVNETRVSDWAKSLSSSLQ